MEGPRYTIEQLELAYVQVLSGKTRMDIQNMLNTTPKHAEELWDLKMHILRHLHKVHTKVLVETT